MNAVISFLLLIIVYSLASRRLKKTNITSAIVFVTAGIILGSDTIGVITINIDNGIFLLVAEIALVLTLFSDASRVNITAFEKSADLSLRMLIIGMPLTIFFGTVFALLAFTDLSVAEAAIIGTILAPTDAGLGKVVVNSPLVPRKIRHSLNIESGLNDGLSVPLLLLFIAIAEAGIENQSFSFWLRFSLEEIGLGIVVGIIIGVVGSSLVKSAKEKDWMTSTYENLIFPALALTIWLTADSIGGSGFIAAFVGGLSAAWVFGKVKDEFTSFIETEGQLIILAVFFLFGSVVVSEAANIDGPTILYAILSLTIIRMIPVAISLIGKELKRESILFMGWFGPRGLASIVLSLTLLELSSSLPGVDRITLTILLTVLLSIFAHGISANPLIKLYNDRTKLDKKSIEKESVVEMPKRAA